MFLFQLIAQFEHWTLVLMDIGLYLDLSDHKNFSMQFLVRFLVESRALTHIEYVWSDFK